MKVRFVLLVAAGLLVAADKAEKEEMKKLQGTWVATHVEQNGRALPARRVGRANVTLIITGNKFSFTSPKMNGQGTIKIDPSKKPKTIDSASEEQTMRGIYEVQGDTLWLCGGTPQRPTGFKSTNGGPSLIIFKRSRN